MYVLMTDNCTKKKLLVTYSVRPGFHWSENSDWSSELWYDTCTQFCYVITKVSGECAVTMFKEAMGSFEPGNHTKWCHNQ